MLILRISKANLGTCFSDLDVKMKRERKKEKGKNEEIHGSVNETITPQKVDDR